MEHPLQRIFYSLELIDFEFEALLRRDRGAIIIFCVIELCGLSAVSVYGSK